MKTFHKISLISFLLIAYLLAGCAVFSKIGKSPYEGKWSYVLNTPIGVYEGFLTLMKDGKTYTGTLSTQNGISDLRDLKIEDGKLSTIFDAEGYTINMMGKFIEDIFSGELKNPEFSLPFSANKVKE